MKIYELVAELCYLGFDQTIAVKVIEHFMKSFEWELEMELTSEQAQQVLTYAIDLLKLVPLPFLQDSNEMSVVLEQMLN